MLDRRTWLLVVGGSALGAGGAAAQQGSPAPASPRAGSGAVGELFNPGVAGRARVPTVEGDNDARIRALEQRLQCTCGCTLDIFTCRTTDFSCTYSPALHREVVALAEAGTSDQEIVDAFVAKYGEKILMAPRPEGFNVAGYVVPGIAIAVAGGVVAWVLKRRLARPALAVAAEPPAAPAATDGVPEEELRRLERALQEIDR